MIINVEQLESFIENEKFDTEIEVLEDGVRVAKTTLFFPFDEDDLVMLIDEEEDESIYNDITYDDNFLLEY